jgi:hypothetical protein
MQMQDGDDDGIMVAENCVVMTSDLSPDQLMSSQSSIGANYPPPDQTPNYPYVSVNEGVPSSTFYGQGKKDLDQCYNILQFSL